MNREQQKAYNAENYPASVLTWLNEATDRAFDECEKKLSNITRVEVIGEKGREFSKWLKNKRYLILFQDENRTIKLFEDMKDELED